MKHYEQVVIDLHEYNNKDVCCATSGSDNIGGWGSDWPMNKNNNQGGIDL
jgi:hypothetical protein